ncbi:SUMO ligase siz1 [Mortierella sp. GBA39]|nr:SUMO ligase siz1 [Mortierella sp. GBA39]
MADYSIMVFCASKEIPTSQQMLMEFPDDCYIRVNNRTLDWRPRGVKNKPGTFTPVDITRFCQLQESSVNHVELRYSNASKVFHASLHLVCPINAKTIVDSLIQKKFIPKEATYRALEKKIKDDDIMELSSTLSLKCPLGVQRIEVPCRSLKCQHLQCFDAFTFLSLNKNVQRWVCPVCNRIMDSWDEIIVDGYYMDILKSTPKSLKNVNVHPDGRWEIPAAIISIDIDDSTSIPTDSGSSSSEPTSHGTDNGPIYVIDDDDDDDEDNRNGSDSSYDTALADLSMEAKEDEVNGAGSRSNYGPSGRQESQPVKNYPLITISPKPTSTLLHLYESSRSQRVPEKSQFMDLTLYSSDDVIDLTSDNEDEDQDQDEDEDDDEELTLHRRKRAFIQPDNDPSNEINDITLTTNDITLTNNSNSGNTGSDPFKCRRVSNKHDNYKRTTNSLSTASNNPEPSDAIMEDLTQPRSFGPVENASTSAMLPKDPRQAEQGHAHPYHTSDIQSTLPPTTHSTAPAASFSPFERLSSPTDGDLTLLQFESAPFMISSLDSIIEGISGHSSVPENAIPPWPAYDPTFVSPYIPYSLGIFGQTSESIGADGYQDQAGLSSNCEQGERFEVDGGLGNGDGEGSEERPSKRPYTASGVPSSSSHLNPELEHETEVRLKSVLKQYMATPDIFL